MSGLGSAADGSCQAAPCLSVAGAVGGGGRIGRPGPTTRLATACGAGRGRPDELRLGMLPVPLALHRRPQVGRTDCLEIGSDADLAHLPRVRLPLVVRVVVAAAGPGVPHPPGRPRRAGAVTRLGGGGPALTGVPSSGSGGAQVHAARGAVRRRSGRLARPGRQLCARACGHGVGAAAAGGVTVAGVGG
eukprot:scaffold24175_cov125-Isochrysis_galbana.AAC.13